MRIDAAAGRREVCGAWKRPKLRASALGLLCAALTCGGANACQTPSSQPTQAPRRQPPQQSDDPTRGVEGQALGLLHGGLPRGAQPAQPRPLPSFCQGSSQLVSADLPSGQASLIRDGFVFVEGPVWVESLGAFLFSEMDFTQPGPQGPPSTIHRLVLPAQIDVFLLNSGSNGLAVDQRGLLACTHDTQTLSRYDLASKRRQVEVADYQGNHFNSPNDVAVHSSGALYFTDPSWQIGERPSETGVTGVYRKGQDGLITRIDLHLTQPNGITLSPDETKLYVSSGDGKVTVYPMLQGGGVGAGQLFASVDEPDGMGVDCAGNLYVTSHAAGKVIIFAPDGTPRSTVQVAPRTTNVAFGGPERRTVLITAGTGIYSVHSPLAGFPY